MIDNESGLGANDYDMGILNWFDTSTAEQREMANNLRSEAQKFSLVCLRELAQKYPEIANLDLTKTTGRCVYFSTIAYVMSASLTIKTSFPEEDHRKMQTAVKRLLECWNKDSFHGDLTNLIKFMTQNTKKRQQARPYLIGQWVILSTAHDKTTDTHQEEVLALADNHGLVDTLGVRLFNEGITYWERNGYVE